MRAVGVLLFDFSDHCKLLCYMFSVYQQKKYFQSKSDSAALTHHLLKARKHRKAQQIFGVFQVRLHITRAQMVCNG